MPGSLKVKGRTALTAAATDQQHEEDFLMAYVITDAVSRISSAQRSVPRRIALRW